MVLLFVILPDNRLNEQTLDTSEAIHEQAYAIML